MKNISVMMLSFALLICCKKENKLSATDIVNKKIDTIKLVDKNQVIFIHPTVSYIDSLKKSYSNKDDFFTAADDAHFYNAEAANYIKKNSIDTVNIDNSKIIKIGNRNIKLARYKPWSLLLYQKGKHPINVFPADIAAEFPKYFSKERKQISGIDKILKEHNFTNIISKKDLDFNNDGNADYIIVSEGLNKHLRTISFIKHVDDQYKLILQNKNAIPCEECGNGAESFYHYQVTPVSLAFSSSYKSNNDIYNIDFEFKNGKDNFYSLNKAFVRKSLLGDSSETTITLDKSKFGNISIGNFNYSDFLSKFILN